jgi:carbamoyl-phosphate synthase large subunit
VFENDLDYELSNPTDRRWLAVSQAMFHEGYTVDRVHDLTKIDRWFLYKIENILNHARELEAAGSIEALRKEQVLKAKRLGFSDKQIALAVNSTEDKVRALRLSLGIRPWVKKIDTLAAEFPADTNYLYTTYNASSHDVTFEDKGTIVLGSGVYRIGSSVEFDWCAVGATQALRDMNQRTVMINYNPETFSTDFDIADRLYFEELSYERVQDIYELEQSSAIVGSFGGQLPQNIILKLQEVGGANVLGTNPKDIDKAEDRQKFSQILDSINVDQPEWKELTSVAEAEAFADKVGYPVLVRPSYVLSGAAMTVIRSQEGLKEKLEAASNVSPDHPVVITKFIESAEEIDVDAVASQGQLLVHAISEHVEQAGVHSGDATLVLPPQNLDDSIKARLKEIAEKVAKAFSITGPFNMQIIKAEDPAGGEPKLRVIECNLRASRSFPFVSKVLGLNFIDVATKALVGKDVPAPQDLMAVKRDYVATKVPQFSWTRLAGADPYLGVEMSSTGEMACFGKDVVEAYWASLQSAMNFRTPQPGEGILFGGVTDEKWLLTIVNRIAPLGYKLYAGEQRVKDFLESEAEGKVTVELLDIPEDKRALREVFQGKDIRGVFVLTHERAKDVRDVNYIMRK